MRSSSGGGASSLALLPARLRGSVLGGSERLVLNLEGGDMTVCCHKASTPDVLGHFPLLYDQAANKNSLAQEISRRGSKCSSVTLRLPQRIALQKVLDLPLAAEENLREVLGYEMDRHTPFKAEQVYYDYEVLGRQTEARRLRVRLTLVARSLLDDALQKITSWGIQPHCVDVADSSEIGHCKINLLPSDRRAPRRKGPGRWIKLGLAGVAAALLVAAIAIPLWRERQQAIELMQQVNKEQAEAEQVQALRTRLEKVIGESRLLIDKKMQSPVLVDVLDELTRIIPDDTWLSSVELKGSQVRIQGESSASSALIGLIEASPLFSQTSFSSPVTQNPTTGHERFQLSSNVESRPGGKK